MMFLSSVHNHIPLPEDFSVAGSNYLAAASVLDALNVLDGFANLYQDVYPVFSDEFFYGFGSPALYALAGDFSKS